MPDTDTLISIPDLACQHVLSNCSLYNVPAVSDNHDRHSACSATALGGRVPQLVFLNLGHLLALAGCMQGPSAPTQEQSGQAAHT